MEESLCFWFVKNPSWFREHNPFEGDLELSSLSIGICNDGTINCDNSEKVGKEIYKQFYNVYFHDATIKQRLKVRNIESLYNSVKISDKKFVAIKPTDLFFQLIAIPQRENNIERFFNYELTTFPMSFFKDGLTWKTKKANLRNTLRTKNVDIDPNSYHVLDGGTLLHKVRWLTSVTFGDVCKLYVDHITSEHGIRTIAFDGCINIRSTKDHEYARRRISNRGCADVQCNVSTKVNIKQDVFLSNCTNKSGFIDMLSSYLINSGNKV